MALISQLLEITAGDTLVVKFALSGTASDGTALNATHLAGATGKWWLGRSARATGPDVLVNKTLTIDAAGMKMTMVLSPSDTINLAPSKSYHHQARVVFADGTVSTCTIGECDVNPSMKPS